MAPGETSEAGPSGRPVADDCCIRRPAVAPLRPRPNMASGQRKRKRMRRWNLLVVIGEAVKQVKPPRAARMLQRARNVPPTRRSAHLHPPRLRSSLGVGEAGDAVSSRRHATHDRRHMSGDARRKDLPCPWHANRCFGMTFGLFSEAREQKQN